MHCTAGPQNQTIETIKNYWRKSLGWKNPGYHFIIKPDGKVEQLLGIENIANGVEGYNSISIHISYIGGVNAKNQPEDNRTFDQKESMKHLVKHFNREYPEAKIQGHRDFPGVKKACPSFEVKDWIKTFL